jgi:hypothetical protein
MTNKKLTPTQIKLKKVLKPIVEGILKEEKYPIFEVLNDKLGKSLYNTFLLLAKDGLSPRDIRPHLEKVIDNAFDKVRKQI